MGRSNKPNPNIGGKLGLVAGIVSAVTPVAIEFIDRIPRKDETEPSEELISMPELCSKKFPLKLDEAKELIEGHGLKRCLSKFASEMRMLDTRIVLTFRSLPAIKRPTQNLSLERLLLSSM